MLPKVPEEIDAAMQAFSPSQIKALLEMRAMIFECASDVTAGPLKETLKWGEPAYLTQASKSGTTIRLGAPKGKADKVALYVSCQTTLVAEFRETLTDDRIAFEKNRAIVVSAEGTLPREALQHCIAQALTYKTRNKAPAGTA